MTRTNLEDAEILEKERKEVLKIATQLLYPEEVVEKLKQAKTINELGRIMKSARRSR